MTHSYTIGLVDDHPLILSGLATAFEKAGQFEVVFAATTLQAAIVDATSIPNIDVLVVDLHIGEEDGTELIQLFQEQCPQCKILVYSQISNAATVRNTVKMNVRGFVTKKHDANVVVEAALKIASGEIFFSSDLVISLVYNVEEDTNGKSILTPQETTIFKMILKGLNLKEIASKLGMAYQTAAKHKASIQEKLDANSDIDLFHRGFEMGYMDLRQFTKRDT